MTLELKRISIGFKKQDAWFGVYWDELNIWVCLIPFFPIKILRKSICEVCHKRIKGRYGDRAWHCDKNSIKYSPDALETCWWHHVHAYAIGTGGWFK